MTTATASIILYNSTAEGSGSVAITGSGAATLGNAGTVARAVIGDLTDIDAWAVDIEYSRLPKIEEDIALLGIEQNTYDNQLSAFVQNWNDRLDAYLALTQAANANAAAANETSAQTSARVYAHELYLQTYVNLKIQQLRDEMDLNHALIDAYLRGDLLNYVDQEVAGVLPALETTVANNTTSVETIRDELLAEMLSIDTANDFVINTKLPEQDNQLTNLVNDLSGTQTQIDDLFTDYPYANVVDGLNNVQSVVEGKLKTIGSYAVALPHTMWCVDADSTTYSPKTHPTVGSFYSDDPVFGDCIELAQGLDIPFGRAYPEDFQTNKLYKVTVRLKVVNDGGFGGVQLALGATTFSGTTAVDVGVEKALTGSNVTVADGDVTFECVFSGDITALNDNGYSVGSGALDNAVYLPGGELTRNKIFFYVRQNAGLATSGAIRVAMIKIEDISEAYQAAATIRQDVVAIDNKLAAGIMLRVDAGDADGSLELVAADDPINGPSSTLRIKADNIIMNGTVGVEKLAVGFGGNHVKNSNFSNEIAGWEAVPFSTVGSLCTVAYLSPGQAWAGLYLGVLDVSQAGPGTEGNMFAAYRGVVDLEGTLGKGIEVQAGAYYEFSARLAASNAFPNLRIDWYTAAGAFISSTKVAAENTSASSGDSPEAWPLNWTGPIQAPANAFFASPGIEHTGSGSEVSWVRLYKPMFTDSHQDASMPTAYSYDGMTLIDGGMILTESVLSDKIAANAITADKIAAGAITANVIKVGSFTNLAYGSDFEELDEVVWPVSSTNGYDFYTEFAHTGTRCLSINGSTIVGDGNMQWPYLLEVTPGEQLYLELYGRRTSDYNGTNTNSKLRIGKADGTQIDNLPYGASEFAAAGTWYGLSKTITVPSDTTRIRIELNCDATAGFVYLDNIQIRRVYGATLIEDGAITTGKIAANAVTANEANFTSLSSLGLTVDTADIANAAIENAKIANGAIDRLAVGGREITKPAGSFNGSTFTISPGEGWNTMTSTSIYLPENQPVHVVGAIACGGSGILRIAIQRDSTIIRQLDVDAGTSTPLYISHCMVDIDYPGSGNTTYYLRVSGAVTVGHDSYARDAGILVSGFVR